MPVLAFCLFCPRHGPFLSAGIASFRFLQLEALRQLQEYSARKNKDAAAEKVRIQALITTRRKTRRARGEGGGVVVGWVVSGGRKNSTTTFSLRILCVGR